MKRKKNVLALPAQAGKDVKTLSNIVERWASQVEEVAEDVFAWAKKHKYLVILGVGLFALKRYWIDEQVEREDEDENFE